MEFDRSLSTVMKTAPRLTSTPLRTSYSETKKKARRELFKPGQRKFLMEEEIFLKYPRKINKTNKKGLRI
ncbi:hypothetical protein O3M35_011383 [Rhynocoris fuscipes]|uniref:Uncharacterized protein n=1 Tax=Rhynocoris fuscipes TaxID=488301 RepID=A0AAW1CWE8_9HEMI